MWRFLHPRSQSHWAPGSCNSEWAHFPWHAAKMKEASLKNKPERRAWEEAASFFKWTCGNYAHVESARQLAAFQDKLEAAEAFRQQGNSDFVEHKLDEALMKFVSHLKPVTI